MNTQKVRDEHGRIIEDEIKFFKIGGNEVAFGFFRNDAKGKRDLEWMMGQWELILEENGNNDGITYEFLNRICCKWENLHSDGPDEENMIRFQKLARKHDVQCVFLDDKDTVNDFLEFTFKRYFDIEHAKLIEKAKLAAEAVKAHERHFNHIQGSIVKTRGN